MRSTYRSTPAALRDALRHVIERGGASSLRALHAGAPSPVALAGSDGTAQAARIRRQLERLDALPRDLLVVAYAPRDIVCVCGSPCCAGRYANPEWKDALNAVLVHVEPLLSGHMANYRLRSTLAANALTRTKETAVAIAARCGVNRMTVAEHARIIEAALMGSPRQAGPFDQALSRVDELLRGAGIVASKEEEAEAA
ncbi:hypothetical protein BG60_29035 [Caballeronia zhejiangensis]|uniref:DNA-binding protein n=2 Tax=Caballeronia zhejiangensis TaxID=871203 RepID=A0A656QQ58_9BURK|nr:hypothetical protein BG60_29035 [Caballeronia zhejiangensis]